MDLHKTVETPVPAAVYAPAPVPAAEFVRGIEELSRRLITKQKIYDYLVSYQIREDELEQYKMWLPERHTRNKIFRNDMIEVMLICWPIGAVTPLHTHNGQLGWMTMLEGKLAVENYRKIRCNTPENEQVVGMDCIAGATEIEMQHLNDELAVPGGPLNTVDKTQTIHRIKNLAEWNERAVSMHVYSRPIDSCVVFDIETQRCFRRDLKYDTE
ncbi:MAG TPA: cysteine dioxygenase family protein [Thermoanaerobaculia bacterium]|jgi:cysteine dioxygenase|nr:cysteine dioxygenase family protein [Thermoanaerobaculia bacterium]